MDEHMVSTKLFSVDDGDDGDAEAAKVDLVFVSLSPQTELDPELKNCLTVEPISDFSLDQTVRPSANI
jgi:hypothetical protein